MTPYQSCMKTAMNYDSIPHIFKRNKRKKDFRIILELGFDDYIRNITDYSDWIDVNTLEGVKDIAAETDNYKNIPDIIKDYYDEINSAVEDFKKPGNFILDFEISSNRFILMVPDKYKQEIEKFLKEFNFVYEINAEYNYEEVNGLIDEIQYEWRDAEEERRDPYGYRGLSRSDF